MRKIALSVIGALALAAVIGFIATSGGLGVGEQASSGGGGRASAPGAGPVPDPVRSVSGDTVVAETALPGLDGGVAGAALGLDASTGIPLTEIGPSIVKTGALRIAVKQGGFNSAFQTASLVAAKYGGYVESSSTAGVKRRSGDLLIRVPSAWFDEAMSDLQDLGQVESQTLSGQDVTSQFVDFEARLLTWEAQESALLKLMARANSVESTLRVQRELQDVQFRIEQIKGQLRVLQNQTDLATIQVAMYEPGAVLPIQQTRAEQERPSLAEAWQLALNGLLGVMYATVVGLGYLVPIAILGLLVGLGYRRFRPRPVAAPVE